jgi:hypothetical protein
MKGSMKPKIINKILDYILYYVSFIFMLMGDIELAQYAMLAAIFILISRRLRWFK